MLIGYARVSTRDQDNELQLRELRRAGVRKVYQEKASGARLQREQLQQLLEHLRPGDELIVYKLDRLARSLRDLLTIADRITAAGATLRSLTEAFDTSTPAGKMAFHMLAAVGQFERDLIRERSAAGLEVARSSGVRMGRPPALEPHKAQQLARRWATKRYSLAELAKMHAVSVSTVKRTLWAAGADTLDQVDQVDQAPKKEAARGGLVKGKRNGKVTSSPKRAASAASPTKRGATSPRAARASTTSRKRPTRPAAGG